MSILVKEQTSAMRALTSLYHPIIVIVTIPAVKMLRQCWGIHVNNFTVDILTERIVFFSVNAFIPKASANVIEPCIHCTVSIPY